MKLTQFTDYCLRVLIYLAAEPDRRATIAEIARAFAISENHLTKVVHHLSKSGTVHTSRGKGGGLELSRAPEDILIGDVVQEAEGESMPAECFGSGEHCCSIEHICRLRGALQAASQAFYATLNGYTLASMAHNKKALRQVLFISQEHA